MGNLFAMGTLVADQPWNHMGWGIGGWIVMGLGMVIFWGLVVAGLVWLVRTAAGSKDRTPIREAPTDALSILERRLAEGSISVDEYRERHRVLTGTPG